MTAALAAFPAVDTIAIGSVPAPGQWILQPCYKVFGWQIQKGWGQSGATVFPIGDEVVVAPFLIRLWDAADYPLFVNFAAQFLKKAVISVAGGVSNFALGISHPELARLGVTSVVVQKSPALTNNGRGLWTGTCEFLQYRVPAAALGKPNATIPGASVPVPKASDKLQQQIQDNAAKIAAARGAG